MGPLDRFTIIELSEGQRGAIAGMLLADYGATVVRVEDPHSPDTRELPGYTVWHRGKQSVTINLGDPGGRGLFLRLLSGADAVLDALPDGETARLGLEYKTLHALYPALVYCSLTGYDLDSPGAGRPAYDGLVQARSGAMVGASWDSGGANPHRPGPKYMGFAAPSYASAFFACLGILGALYRRGTTGQGQHINTSMHGAVMAMTRWSWAEDQGPTPPPARGLYGIWVCQDGEWVWTHTGARGSFDRFMDVFGFPEYKQGLPSPMPWTNAAGQELRQRVTALFKTKPRGEWMRLFEKADVPNAAARRPGESFDDAQVRAVDMVAQVKDPRLGVLEEVGLPIKFQQTPGAVRGPAPRQGEHTAAVLKKIGLQDAEVNALRTQGVI